MFVATLIAMAVYYPIKDFTGSIFCHLYIFGLAWVNIFGQSLTFFITLFRYICLYHDGKLSAWRITPKVCMPILSNYLILTTQLLMAPSRAGASHSSSWRIFISARLMTFFLSARKRNWRKNWYFYFFFIFCKIIFYLWKGLNLQLGRS